MSLALIIMSLVAMPMQRAESLARSFSKAALEERVSAPVLVALAKDESNFSMRAKSDVGARGMLQILPKFWGYHPNQDKHALVAARVLKMYEGKCRTTLLALGAYRSGRCVAGPKAQATIKLARRIQWQLAKGE